MADGIQVLVTPDGGLRKGPRRPGWDKGLNHNRQIHRFQRRGRPAARTEWRLITATHNLLKLHDHHLATT